MNKKQIKSLILKSFISIAVAFSAAVAVPDFAVSKNCNFSLITASKVYAAANLSQNNIKTISTGNSSFAVKTDGTLWACGINKYGQLGDGTTTKKPVWEQVGSDFSQVVFSGSHSLALKTDGTLWACGSNSYGQLGDGSTTNKQEWEQVGSGFSQIACGWCYSLALKTDGTLYACGLNSDGQLGDGSTTNKQVWEKVGSGFSQIACGGYHSLALKTDGGLWACGDNEHGELGDNSVSNKSSWEQVGTNFSQIVCGSYHSLALKTDGTLYSCGDNEYGQLGDNSTSNKSSWEQVGSGFSQVACGMHSSIALKSDGTLYSCGNNTFGELGDGTESNKSSWEQVGSGFSKVSGGDATFLAIKPDGTLYGCGDNAFGELGDGTMHLTTVFKQVLTGVAINNKDTTAPTAPSINLDKNKLIITGGSDSESGVKETDYQLNNGAWIKYTGSVTLDDGNYTINAKTIDNAGNSSVIVTMKADVNENPIVNPTVNATAIALNKSVDLITIGQTDILTASITPTNTSNKNAKWTSSDSSVASVDQSGKVTAIKAGTAVITASTQDGTNLSDSCTVTVNAQDNRTVTLKLTLVDDILKTYEIPQDELNDFIKWYYAEASDKDSRPVYVLNVPATENSKAEKVYIAFSRIILVETE